MCVVCAGSIDVGWPNWTFSTSVSALCVCVCAHRNVWPRVCCHQFYPTCCQMKCHKKIAVKDPSVAIVQNYYWGITYRMMILTSSFSVLNLCMILCGCVCQRSSFWSYFIHLCRTMTSRMYPNEVELQWLVVGATNNHSAAMWKLMIYHLMPVNFDRW